MQTVLLSLITFGLTIVFALIIAAVIQGVGYLVYTLAPDRQETASDPIVPTADSEREQQALAVAIAIAHRTKNSPRS